MQVYNLGIDDKSKQNNAEIQYLVTDLTTNKQVLDTSESTAKMNPNADQVTLEKTSAARWICSRANTACPSR